MLSTIIGLFLIAHGMMHAILALAPIPNDPTSKRGTFFAASKRSWLLRGLGFPEAWTKWIGILLVAAATISFIFAGIGVLGVPVFHALWRTVAVISAATSMVLLILFWHSRLLLGFVIDAVILVTLMWLNWTVITLSV
jgi:hypothetical protein